MSTKYLIFQATDGMVTICKVKETAQCLRQGKRERLYPEVLHQEPLVPIPPNSPLELRLPPGRAVKPLRLVASPLGMFQ